MLLLSWLACHALPADTEPGVVVDSDTDLGADTDTDVGHTDVDDTDTSAPDTDTDAPPDPGVAFAVIGDFSEGQAAADVSALVKSWSPDFIVTVGDNNYNTGELSTIDANIGQYYHEFIHPYAGAWGPGATKNRFFPSLGNHDWYQPGAWAYIYWFELPGKEYYYEFVRGPVHLFALDSDPNEPDGITADSVQGKWLQEALARSTSRWNVVYFHHPPYNSGQRHGPSEAMRWPFAEWGADLVLAGHEHVYERLAIDGITYVTQGLGGRSLYEFDDALLPDSIVQFDADYAATRIDADEEALTLSTWTRAGVLVDRYTLGEDEPELIPLVPADATWRWLDTGEDPGPLWTSVGFDERLWAFGPAPLGYGAMGLASEVGFGPDPAAKPVTTWFRTSFEVADPTAISELHLDLARDDGAVVWLNGVEILRSGLPPGAVSPSTLASRDVAFGSEEVFQPAWLPATALVAGTNVLAVEVHQAAVSSPDLRLQAVLGGR